MTQIFMSVVNASVAGTVMAVGTIALQAASARWLTPAWRYRLWGLVVVRLVILVLPASALSLANVDWEAAREHLFPHRERAAVAVQTYQATQEPKVSVIVTYGHAPLAGKPMAVQPALPIQASHNWLAWMSVTWFAVAIFLLVRLVVLNMALALRLSRARALRDVATLELLDRCQVEMKVRRRVLLLETDEVRVPAAAGVWQAKILLPTGLFAGLSYEEQRAILLHELAHVRCWDVAVSWVLAVIQIVHWFNPLVRLAFVRMRADREIARDAMVLQASDQPVGPEGYAAILVKLTESQSARCRPGGALPSLAGMVDGKTGMVTGLFEGRSNLNRRIRLIQRQPEKSQRSFAAPVFIMILAACTLTRAQDKPAATLPAEAGHAMAGSPVVATTQAEMTSQELALQKQLDKRLPEIKFDGVQFSDVIDYLRDVTGSNIFVDYKTMEAAGFDRKTPIRLTLHDVEFSSVLKVILNLASTPKAILGYTTQDGVITISTLKQLHLGVVTKTYDVRDLIAYNQSLTSTTQPAASDEDFLKSLCTFIENVIVPDSWKDKGGDTGTIAYQLSGGQIVITQLPEYHTKVNEFLGRLRRGRISNSAVQIKTAIATTQKAESLAVFAMQKKLDMVLPMVKFNAVQFKDAIGYVSDATQANIFVNYRALEAVGVDSKTPITISLNNVKLSKLLSTILEGMSKPKGKLGYVAQDGVITISSFDQLHSEVETRVYDVRDLLICAPQGHVKVADGGGLPNVDLTTRPSPSNQQLLADLATIIEDSIAPDSWRDRGGALGSISTIPASGQMVITQISENLSQIESLLKSLRDGRNAMITVDMKIVTCEQALAERMLSQWKAQHSPATEPTAVFEAQSYRPPAGIRSSAASTSSTYFLTPAEVNDFLKVVQSSSQATVKAAPRITLSDGGEAYVKVGASTDYTSDYSIATAPSGQVRYEPITSNLEFGWSIAIEAAASSDRKEVTLKLDPKIVNLREIKSVPWRNRPAGSTLMVGEPDAAGSELVATVSLPDQGTAVLGGLPDPEDSNATQPAVKRLWFVLVKPTILVQREKVQ